LREAISNQGRRQKNIQGGGNEKKTEKQQKNTKNSIFKPKPLSTILYHVWKFRGLRPPLSLAADAHVSNVSYHSKSENHCTCFSWFLIEQLSKGTLKYHVTVSWAILDPFSLY